MQVLLQNDRMRLLLKGKQRRMRISMEKCLMFILKKMQTSLTNKRVWTWKSLSRVQLFATPWTVAHQAPLSMEFSRAEYWSGLPFPSPGDLPNPGIKPKSPTLLMDSFTVWAQKINIYMYVCVHIYTSFANKHSIIQPFEGWPGVHHHFW